MPDSCPPPVFSRRRWNPARMVSQPRTCGVGQHTRIAVPSQPVKHRGKSSTLHALAVLFRFINLAVDRVQANGTLKMRGKTGPFPRFPTGSSILIQPLAQTENAPSELKSALQLIRNSDHLATDGVQHRRLWNEH